MPPQTFAETIAQLEELVLQQVAEQAARQQLYYHTEAHLRAVQRRSHQILQTIAPALEQQAIPGESPVEFARMERLLDFCAIAHDMVQIFEHSSEKHTARRRQPGVSEIATVDQLVQSIDQFNQQMKLPGDRATTLTDVEIAVIRQAITATICHYDAIEQAIYQPLLYSSEQPLSLVTRILALADLNTLAMDGVEAYNQEGSLLFLEENPDVVPLLEAGALTQLEQVDPDLSENIRQRLLKRSRFQVNFAKSRLIRLPQELQGFPPAALSELKEKIFGHLKGATVEHIQATTPTHDQVPLGVLLKFFAFEHVLKKQGQG